MRRQPPVIALFEQLAAIQKSLHDATIPDVSARKSEHGEVEVLLVQTITTLVEREGGEISAIATELWGKLFDIAAELHTEQKNLEASESGDNKNRHTKKYSIDDSKKSLERTRSFPKDAQALGMMLTRLSPILQKTVGIECTKLSRTATGRPWRLSNRTHAEIGTVNTNQDDFDMSPEKDSLLDFLPDIE